MKELKLFKKLMLTFLAFLMAFCAVGQEWPGWRGPDRDDKVEGFKAPKIWPVQLNQVWQKEVGLGDASPVYSGSYIFLHVKQEGNEVALCLNMADGETAWSTVLNPAPEVTGGPSSHPGPRSTPCVAGGKVFTLGVGGVVHCLNAATGKVIWKNESFTEVPQFYAGMSPIVVDNLCIYHLGGHDNGVVVAFNVADGAIRWTLKGEPSTYASPVLMQFGSNKVLAIQTETDFIGVSPEGKLLWKRPTPPERRYYNSSTPVVEGQNVFIAGQGIGTKSGTIVKNGDKFTFSENWTNPDFGVSFSTPVYKNGFLYGNEGRLGKLFCLNASTGAAAWADTVTHNRFASVLDLGQVIMSLPATGKLIFFEPNPENYTEKAVYKIADTDVYAHPLVVGSKIYVKDQKNLTCWEL